MDKKQTATELMNAKFNCAQAVFAALADEVGSDRETALKTAACFGGGMRCGEVCGAVTGALMALGLRFGSSTENDVEGKEAAYKKSLEFISRFKENHGTMLCRELLKSGVTEQVKSAAKQGTHPEICIKAVTDAVAIAEEILNET